MGTTVLSDEQLELGYKLAWDHVVPPWPVCVEKFSNEFAKYVARYHIHKGAGDYLSSQRVAYLCGIQMLKLFGDRLGSDAEYEFFYWARKHRLICDEITDRERMKNGKTKVDRPFPSRYEKHFSKITFKRMTDVAMSILEPTREPVLKRTPVTRAPELKRKR